MTTDRILIAGIGNIFLGDDAFGVEVVRRLAQAALPEGVRVADFGIRSYDLAYALMEERTATVLVDTTRQGGSPGTLYLLEPDTEVSDTDAPEMSEGAVVNAHGMNPVEVLRLVRLLGGETGRLYVLGCEPAVLESSDGALGLSAPVEAAVPKAVEMIQTLIADLLRQNEPFAAGLEQAQKP